MDSEIAKRPGVQRLFWHLTLFWAVVCLCRAAVTFWLLESQPLVSFIVLKNLSLLAMTGLGVTVTVAAAVWVAAAKVFSNLFGPRSSLQTDKRPPRRALSDAPGARTAS
jgi:hypothetical protein